LKFLVEIQSREQIPETVRDGRKLVVLQPDSYKFLAEYLSTAELDEMVYVFMWSDIEADNYLKTIEDYEGGLTIYRCSKGEGKDLKLSSAFLSRFNMCFSRCRYKYDVGMFAPSRNEGLLQGCRKIFAG
jgi:hypothetical protein